MVKPLKIKPNILERRRLQAIAAGKQVPAKSAMPKDKGEYEGTCNMSRCLKPGSAVWYNWGSMKYYCANCAHWLNSDTFNKREAKELWGHDMCTLGKREDYIEQLDEHLANIENHSAIEQELIRDIGRKHHRLMDHAPEVSHDG